MNYWHTAICLVVFTTYLCSTRATSNLEDSLLSRADRRNLRIYTDLANKPKDNIDSIIKFDGYPVETHSVTTKDGYILTCTRIPHGKRDSEATREPILLSPGLVTTAGSWLSVSPQSALPYLLADRGYDVWLATYRGNPISSEHVKYSAKNPDYWDYSMDEQGIYDAPALIDLVLIKSRKKKLSIVCMSIGCAYIYMALTTDTSYNDKIHKIVNLAPGIHLSYIEAPGWANLATMSKLFQEFIPRAVTPAKIPFLENLYDLGFVPCGPLPRRKICLNPIFNLLGFEPSQHNDTTLAKFRSLTKIKLGLKMFTHILQRVNSGKFQRFDYGEKTNELIYGRAEAPEYDLSRVKVLSMLSIISRTDRVIVPKAVKLFEEELPSKINQSWKVVNSPDFSHLDFLVHDNVKELVYDDIIEFLEKDIQKPGKTVAGALKKQAKLEQKKKKD